MAGYDDGHRIAAQGLADGTRSAGRARQQGELAVGHRLTPPDATRRLVDLAVELGHARQVQRNAAKVDLLPSKIALEAPDRLLHLWRWPVCSRLRGVATQ